MSPVTIGLFGLVIAFVLVFLRMPIAFAFGFVGFAGIWVVKGFQPAIAALGTIPFGTMSNYAWTVIPLFVFMGYIAQQTKLAQEFYAGVRNWVGSFRGGLASAIIIGNAGFGACSGDSISAACTFAAVSLPETRKYKYADTLTIGSVGAGSVLAQLIPPSFGFIVYGIITETSVGKLFVAGILPGLILILFYFCIIYLMCRINPTIGPKGPKTTWKEKIGSGTGMWALIAIFVVIIGGLYIGLFTPTEAAGAGVFVTLIIGLSRKRLTGEDFKTALLNTGLVASMVFFLVIGVSMFNLFLVITGAHLALGKLVAGITDSPVILLFIFAAIKLILGTALDVLSITLLIVPLLFPVAVKVGIDPIQFGVLTVVTGSVGTLSPPFGIVVYAMSGVIKDVPLFTIFRGMFPFILAMIILVVLVILFPQISVFLPATMRGG